MDWEEELGTDARNVGEVGDVGEIGAAATGEGAEVLGRVAESSISGEVAVGDDPDSSSMCSSLWSSMLTSGLSAKVSRPNDMPRAEEWVIKTSRSWGR